MKRAPATRPPAALLGGLLATLLLAGCGERLPRVSGTVTLDGELVRGTNNVRCLVLFFPESGIGAPAVAAVDESGRFSLGTGSRAGARAGKYKVAVTVKELSDPGPDGGLPGNRRLAPPKYGDPSTSGWTVEVVSGSNEFDFEIESDG